MNPEAAERHLPEYRFRFYFSKRKLAPLRLSVYPHSSLLEDEEPLTGVLWGIEGLSCLKVSIQASSATVPLDPPPKAALRFLP